MRLKLNVKRHYLFYALVAIVWIIFLRFAFEWDAIPFRFDTFLFYSGNPFVTAAPIFIIGFALNAYKMINTVQPLEAHKSLKSIPLTGFTTSLMAGVLEEITFRWVMFFGFLGIFWLLDKFVGGSLQSLFVDNGPLYFLNIYAVSGYVAILQPVGNWAIGLAALCSNWKFQEGHSYQGITGNLFSWVGGLFFFKVMFVNGLLAAIFVHFIFDLMTFVMLILDILYEKYVVGVYNAHTKIYNWY